MIQKFNDFKTKVVSEELQAEEIATFVKENYSDLTEEQILEMTEEMNGIVGMAIGAGGAISAYVASLIYQYKKIKKADPNKSDLECTKEAFHIVGQALSGAHS